MSDKGLSGIEFLESLPDGCLFLWNDIRWFKSSSRSGVRWSHSTDYFFRDYGEKEMCTGGLDYSFGNYGSTDELIATASKDTVTILYPEQEEFCEWEKTKDGKEEEKEQGVE